MLNGRGSRSLEHKSLEGDGLDRTIQDIESRNADSDPGEIQLIVDEVVAEVRAEGRTKLKADKA